MPWIVGTALMHSLIVTEKRGTFKAWTVLLAIFAFSLSLLGTFLVRSGVLTSVHAFASDPARGVFILIFLCIVVGGSLLLYAWRAPQIKSASTFEFISRETGLLVNNVILVAIGSSILLGTLYPLILDATTGAKISVGPPYFGTIFLILLVPLTIMLGFGQFLKWKEDDAKAVFAKLRTPMIVSVVLGVAFVFVSPFFDWQQVTTFELFQAIIGMILGIWVMSTTVMSFYQRIKGKASITNALLTLPRGFYGMTTAHIGMGVFIVGMILATVFSLEKDVRLLPGESYSLAHYTFKFNGVRNFEGPNYSANEGSVTVTKDGETVAVMRPQKRIYRVQRNAMTEAAIDDGITRDLFVALGEKLDDQGAWSLRLYHKPFLRWIWLGAIFMALGGILAASDRRYLLAARRSVQETEVAKAALAGGAA
jgi:cytochrome c-type biogenesis protein CcmF